METLKICSWNILAPELFFYFWRSSYGLGFTDKNSIPLPKEYYDGITNLRLKNIIDYLQEIDADVILLQEVTTTKYTILDSSSDNSDSSDGLLISNQANGLTLQVIIAEALNYKIVSESFKTNKFSSGLPPYEQHKDRTESSTYSGIATLVRPDLECENLITSTRCKRKTNSPFTLDRLRLGNNDIFIGNVHIKMDYPHILESVIEVYNCIIDTIGEGILRTILMGDFNAHALAAANELYKSVLNSKMFDIFASQLIDDHIFVGNEIRLYESSATLDTSLPLLDMQVNSPATGRKWIVENTKYNHSDYNQKLVDGGKVTTDHYPIIVKFNFTRKRAKKPSILV